jgi:hypothetical protein
VARQYGVYRDRDGTSERALFVIDGDGIIRWSYVSPVGINPGADGILRALEALPKGKSMVFSDDRAQLQALSPIAITRRALPTRRSRWSSMGTTNVHTAAGLSDHQGRAAPPRRRLRFVFRNFPLSGGPRARATRRRGR